MYSSAQQAYETCEKSTGSSRELEAAALFKAARLLEACRLSWEASVGSDRFHQALKYNMRLWSFFQSELGRPDHEMPARLRADLLRLSAFIDRRTFELMAKPEPQKLQALIDINRNIAMGLSASSQ